jgi:hypothetical protein
MHNFGGIEEVKVDDKARLIGNCTTKVELGLIGFETASSVEVQYAVKVISSRRLIEVVVGSEIKETVNGDAGFISQPFLRGGDAIVELARGCLDSRPRSCRLCLNGRSSLGGRIGWWARNICHGDYRCW